MSTVLTFDTKKPTADKKTPATEGPRCLSRRVWDWGKHWGEALIHLVWFWRAAVLILLIIAGIFAFNQPDFQHRIAATGLLLGLGLLLALDLLVAFLNLPLLLFYTSLWSLLSLTSLIDLPIYNKRLSQKQNRIALWVLLANVALIAAIVGVWWVFTSSPEAVEPIQPFDLRDVPSLLE